MYQFLASGNISSQSLEKTNRIVYANGTKPDQVVFLETYMVHINQLDHQWYGNKGEPRV